MATGPTREQAVAVKRQLLLMGWRFVPGPSGHRWIKLYPPPHEVVNPKGRLKIIGRMGDDIWRRDLDRAKVLAFSGP